MKKKLFWIFILTIMLFSSFEMNKKYVKASNEKIEKNNQNEKIYLENEYFKISFDNDIEEENTMMPINMLKVFSKKANKQIDDKWSSAVILNNGNCILGSFDNEKYYYYEVNKQGEKNFLIELDYYIKDIDKKTGNYIIIEPYDIKNNQFLLGILDKEFKVIYNPIFEYKKAEFKNGTEIFKLLNGKYGLFSINGETVIEPIFDSLSYNTENTIKAIYNGQVYTLEKYTKGYKNITTIKDIDAWAKEFILSCIDLGIVSDKLQLKFKEPITREEFCEVIIKLYEMKTGLNVEFDKNKAPFSDTNNESILKAYNLNIISGKGNNKFEPNSFITREEAAVILNNLMNAMGISTNISNKIYKDNNQISKWAYNSVMIVSEAGIMNGNNGYFKPKDRITVQEALTTIFRLH